MHKLHAWAFFLGMIAATYLLVLNLGCALKVNGDGLAYVAGDAYVTENCKPQKPPEDCPECPPIPEPICDETRGGHIGETFADIGRAAFAALGAIAQAIGLLFVRPAP